MPGVPPSFADENTFKIQHPSSYSLEDTLEISSSFLRSKYFLKKHRLLIALTSLAICAMGIFLTKEIFFSSETKHFAYLKGPCPSFIGRKKQLDLLHKELTLGLKQKKFRNCIKIKMLWGKGGFGKSELAIEFANRYFSSFSLIWTFLCDSQEHIDQGYRQLAEKLGISYKQDSLENIKKNVHWHLENHHFDLPWLLIFDNVEKEFTDYPQKGGMILVTSQKKILKPEFLLEVEPFSREEAIEFLEKITLEKRNLAMERLIEKLEGIPLLINYAAYYIKATPGCDVAEYQKLFSSHLLEKEGPLWKELDVNQRYLKSLAVSWHFSLKSLEQENPYALQWLFICSYLYPEHICEEWIDEWLTKKILNKKDSVEIERKKILKSLQNYGIIRYEEKARTFSCHRFFQAVIRESRKSLVKEDLSQVILLLANHATGYRFEEPSSWRQGERWYLHAREAQKWLQVHPLQFSEQSTKTQEMLLYEGIGKWGAFNDRYEEALEANYKALNLRKSIGEENPLGIGMIYESIGFTLFRLERYAEAIAACNKALEALHHCLGKKPLEYALSLNTKGVILWEQGKYEEALTCHDQALQLRLIHLGEIHIHTGFSLNNKALALRDLFRYQEALKLNKQALEIYRKTCGEKHPWFIWALQNQAWIILNEGRYTQALKLFSRALATDIVARGKNHGGLTYDWNGIGWCHFHLENFKQAKKAFKQAIRIGLSHYKKNTRPIIRAYKGLGWSYIEDKQVKKGLKYLLLHIKFNSKIYQNTPKMLSILENFKSALEKAQKHKGEIELIKHAADTAHKISEETLGKDHLLTQFFKKIKN